MFEQEYQLNPGAAAAPPVQATPAVSPAAAQPAQQPFLRTDFPGGGYFKSVAGDINSSLSEGQYAKATGQALRGVITLPYAFANDMTDRIVEEVSPALSGLYQGFTGVNPQAGVPQPAAKPVTTAPVRPTMAAPVQSKPAEQPAQPMAMTPVTAAAQPSAAPMPTATIVRPSYVNEVPSLNRAQISGNLGGLQNAILALTAGRYENNQRTANFKNALAAEENTRKNVQTNQQQAETDANLQGKRTANESAAFDLQRKKQLADIERQIAEDDGKDPKKTQRLQQQRMALVGKQAKQFQVVTQEEPIDPANPALGTKKTPILVDNEGNARAINLSPSAAASPQGMKVVGTSNGVPVYEDAQGNRFTK